MEWFIHDGERKIGPVSADALRAMAATGKIDSETLLWRPGMKSWTKASLVPGVLIPPIFQSSVNLPHGLVDATERSGSLPDTTEAPRQTPNRESISAASNRDHPEAQLSARPTELATPWRRFWARILDITLFSMLVGFAIGIAMPSLFTPSGLFGGPGGEQIMGWICLPLVMVFDGVILGLFGTTPGKAIAGVHVSGLRGQKLRVGDAIQRNFQLWWYGLGTGFPIVFLFTLVSSYRKASRGDQTQWELSTGARSYARAGGTRTLVTAVLFVAIHVGLAMIDDNNNSFDSSASGLSKPPTVDDPAWWERELQAVVVEINRDAPMFIDEFTRLDGAMAGPGKTLTYRYTLLETDVDDIPPNALQEFDAVMTEALRSDTCANTDTRGLLDFGVRLLYSYRDSYGRAVTELEVNGGDCPP